MKHNLILMNQTISKTERPSFSQSHYTVFGGAHNPWPALAKASAICWIMIFTWVASQSSRAGTFISDFTKGVDTNYWGLWTSFPAGYCTNINDAQGVTFQRIAGSDRQSFTAGLTINMANMRKITTDGGGLITGDFAVTMTYTNLNNLVSSSGDYWTYAGNQLKLYLQWGDGGAPERVHVVQVLSFSRNYPGFQATAFQGSVVDSQYPWQGGQLLNIQPAPPGNSATLKMARTNGVLSYYVNDQQLGVGEGDSTSMWTTNGLWSVNLVLKQGLDAAHVGVTLQSCSISGPSVKDNTPVVQQWTTNNLPAGLISWWNADTNTLDVTGLNPASSSGQTYAPGRFGQAFHFDGINQSVVAPGSASLDQWTQFTLEAWMKLDKTEDVAGGAPGRMVINRVGNATDHVNFNQGYQFGFWDNARRLVLNFSTNGQAWTGFATEAVLPASMPTNVWLHYAATYDHNAVTLYLNGVPLKTNVVGAATVAHSTSSFRIGMDDNGNCPFPGSIDDVRVYSRALSAAEIAHLCAGPNPPVTRPVLKYTPKGDGKLTFEWDTINGQMYHVESATSLVNPGWQPVGWQPVGDSIIATNTLTSVSYPIGAQTPRFYRVVTP